MKNAVTIHSCGVCGRPNALLTAASDSVGSVSIYDTSIGGCPSPSGATVNTMMSLSSPSPEMNKKVRSLDLIETLSQVGGVIE